MIDLRHAPGPSLDEIKASGKDVAGAGTRGLFESATNTCAHCHRQVILQPDRSRERGYCRKCDHYLCDECSLQLKLGGDCAPMNMILDKVQDQGAKNPSRIKYFISKLRQDIFGDRPSPL